MTADRIGRRTAGVARAFVLSASLVLAACAAKPLSLPSEHGAPSPDAPAAYVEATSQCRGVKSLSAELALSGRAAGTKLRGRIVGGFAAPGKIRLEAPAPFGRPVFTLVARGETATLVLNRDRRVVRDASPAALVEALAGVSMGPDDLRGAVAGCGFSGADLAGGESYPGDWIAGDAGGARAWLRKVDGAWRLVATARGPLEIRYDQFVSGRPSVVQLRSTAQGNPATDITLRLSQVDINVPLEDSVFDVEVPADAQPMTLDELRRSGTLGSASGSDGRPPGGEPERP